MNVDMLLRNWGPIKAIETSVYLPDAFAEHVTELGAN